MSAHSKIVESLKKELEELTIKIKDLKARLDKIIEERKHVRK